MRSIQAHTTLAIDAAEAQLREALAAEGFGVITEIDIAATLRNKIGVERSPMKILGACNPTFAHRALELDESVALMLPCNVVLAATADGTRIDAVDPRDMMDDASFRELATEVANRLEAAVAAMRAQ